MPRAIECGAGVIEPTDEGFTGASSMESLIRVFALPVLVYLVLYLHLASARNRIKLIDALPVLWALLFPLYYALAARLSQAVPQTPNESFTYSTASFLVLWIPTAISLATVLIAMPRQRRMICVGFAIALVLEQGWLSAGWREAPGFAWMKSEWGVWPWPWVLCVGAAFIIASVREERRSPMRCVKCGYSLKDLTEPVCPECGTEFETDEPHEQN